MAFAEGQPVLFKSGQSTGTIHRKLSYLQDMYVVQLDGAQNPVKKLAHVSDLEPLPRRDRLSA
ncbi:MAG TPA: hypothetical protein VHU89_05140 [Acidobacteriaceae bacterium]|jgi:hypothetical protein|nr:hypothetical protein [Acidobacteriaceae bacterium]